MIILVFFAYLIALVIGICFYLYSVQESFKKRGSVWMEKELERLQSLPLTLWIVYKMELIKVLLENENG